MTFLAKPIDIHQMSKDELKRYSESLEKKHIIRTSFNTTVDLQDNAKKPKDEMVADIENLTDILSITTIRINNQYEFIISQTLITELQNLLKQYKTETKNKDQLFEQIEEKRQEILKVAMEKLNSLSRHAAVQKTLGWLLTRDFYIYAGHIDFVNILFNKDMPAVMKNRIVVLTKDENDAVTVQTVTDAPKLPVMNHKEKEDLFSNINDSSLPAITFDTEYKLTSTSATQTTLTLEKRTRVIRDSSLIRQDLPEIRPSIFKQFINTLKNWNLFGTSSRYQEAPLIQNETQKARIPSSNSILERLATTEASKANIITFKKPSTKKMPFFAILKPHRKSTWEDHFISRIQNCIGFFKTDYVALLTIITELAGKDETQLQSLWEKGGKKFTNKFYKEIVAIQTTRTDTKSVIDDGLENPDNESHIDALSNNLNKIITSLQKTNLTSFKIDRAKTKKIRAAIGEYLGRQDKDVRSSMSSFYRFN